MMIIFNHLRSLLLASLFLLTLSSCAREAEQDTASVSVTAVNYTDRELNGYLFLSPEGEKKQVAGGPPARPFEEAGTMCCYSLPAKWRKGIRVRLQYDWWQGSDQPRQYIVKEVEVPPYPDGQVGTLWALLYPDDSVEVVSSDFAPGHAKWPGKEKGWPKPSVAYQRTLWELEYQELQARLQRTQKTLSTFGKPHLAWAWDFYSKFPTNIVDKFYGPDDPNFVEYEKSKLEQDLKEERDNLKALEKKKP